ncbi:Sporulation kinase A [Chitinispirillum alkaliphilum]|nr:Sporulation kinase A [Chitinispirillum alkaliphilum]
MVFVCASCGFFSAFVENSLNSLPSSSLFPELEKPGQYFVSLLSSIYHYITPYTLLMLALSNLDNRVRLKRHLKLLKFLLLIPVVFMYIFFPFNVTFNPDHIVMPGSKVMSVWAPLYILATVALLLYAFFITPENRLIKREKLFLCILVIPPATSSIFVNYLINFTELKGYWRYNQHIVASQILLYLIFLVNYGFCGIRIKVEKANKTNPVSGLGFLNHSIKDHVSVIKYQTEYVLEQIQKSDLTDKNKLTPELRDIQDSTNHLLGITKSIYTFVNDTAPELKMEDLQQLFGSACELLKKKIKEKKIILQCNYEQNITIPCDLTQIVECFFNLMKNSIEAMPDGGVLSLVGYRDGSRVVMIIRDQGCGIDQENLVHITQPFFTTKGCGNWGLGLMFCSKVFKSHGWDMQIDSKLNHGTSITIVVPGAVFKKNSFRTVRKSDVTKTPEYIK